MYAFKQIALVLALAFTTLSGQAVSAQDFNKGLAAYNSDDYATALQEWRPLAEVGDRKAQYHLGYMHSNGLGVIQDYAEAAEWYRLSLAAAHIIARRSQLCESRDKYPVNASRSDPSKEPLPTEVKVPTRKNPVER